MFWRFWSVFLFCACKAIEDDADMHKNAVSLYSLEGKIEILTRKNKSWLSETQVHVDGGKYYGFLRVDGNFTVNGLPPGVYLVEAIHPVYSFEAVFVYIFSTGRKRAKKADFLQRKNVQELQYPLLFRGAKRAKFFEKRDKFQLQDILSNPMLLSMGLPFLLLLIIPKMLTLDPNVQEQFTNQLNTMTGGRANMIGMGRGQNNGGRNSSEERGGGNERANPMSLFSFDLAEILTDYFYQDNTQKSSETEVQKRLVPDTKRRKGRKRRRT